MIVKFLKTGDLYTVLNENIEMKNPETREWLRAVSYKKFKVLENNELRDPGPEFEGRIFVREYQDFNQKFKICQEF